MEPFKEPFEILDGTTEHKGNRVLLGLPGDSVSVALENVGPGVPQDSGLSR